MAPVKRRHSSYPQITQITKIGEEGRPGRYRSRY